jgi:hypothetical protein
MRAIETSAVSEILLTVALRRNDERLSSMTRQVLPGPSEVHEAPGSATLSRQLCRLKCVRCPGNLAPS